MEEQEKSKTPNGYCAPYLGQICRNHVPKNSLVFYNLSDADDFAANINEEIVSSLWSELIVSLLEPCRSAAEKLLCYYAFPQCEWSKVGSESLLKIIPPINRFYFCIGISAK